MTAKETQPYLQKPTQTIFSENPKTTGLGCPSPKALKLLSSVRDQLLLFSAYQSSQWQWRLVADEGAIAVRLRHI